jgi:5-carboxymethyl-2-hydroxymuconate isomerase
VASRDGLPIARPSKIICAGLNYRDHAEEQGLELPERPLLFAKWPNALIGPGESIVLPPLSSQVDYEAELAVVIGARVRGASVENALEAVAGFVCLNDVTARDLQFADGQWTRAKSFDTFCPVGPVLAPLDAVGDPQRLRIRCLVNGEVLQDSSTANMVFSVAELIAFASEAIELQPGDLIATGTPAGVGYTREPQRFLRPGDEVTVEIAAIGALTNPVRG